MGQSQLCKQIALVVEDDPVQRETIVTLLEESAMQVIECESGEAAELVLEHVGADLTTLLTDVNLAGTMDGIELAHCAPAFSGAPHRHYVGQPSREPASRWQLVHCEALEAAGAASRSKPLEHDPGP